MTWATKDSEGRLWDAVGAIYDAQSRPHKGKSGSAGAAPRHTYPRGCSHRGQAMEPLRLVGASHGASKGLLVSRGGIRSRHTFTRWPGQPNLRGGESMASPT